MKFTTAATLLALPFMAMASPLPAAETAQSADAAEAPAIAKRNCNLNALWESNWRDGIHHRYRVRGTASTGGSQGSTRAMLEEWCKIFMYCE